MPRGIAKDPVERSRKISEKRKLQIPPMTGKKHSKETLAKMSVSAKKRGVSELFLAKARTNRLGKPAWNKGISAWWVKGDKSPMWQGGITPLSQMRIQSIEWRETRKAVYQRDNWTCQHCCKKCSAKGDIQCHHIIPYRISKNDDISNLVTLCRSCHRKADVKLRAKEVINNEN